MRAGKMSFPLLYPQCFAIVDAKETVAAGRNKKEGEYSWCPHICSHVAVTGAGDRLDLLRPLVVLLKEEDEKAKKGEYLYHVH